MNKWMKKFTCFGFLIMSLIFLSAFQKESGFQIAILKYGGGGDWYANPSSLTNLIHFTNQQLGTNIHNEYATVEVASKEIFNYPFIHMTGHGNVVFNSEESENLRNYLLAGGFLHIDDNYGMDPFIRIEIKKVFPELELVELPPTHPIFHQTFSFKNGLPKIHEHDNKAPQAFALIYKGEIVCLYTYECDLGDGWEDQSVHKDSKETRLKALQMGANILEYAFNGGSKK